VDKLLFAQIFILLAIPNEQISENMLRVTHTVMTLLFQKHHQEKEAISKYTESFLIATAWIL